MDIRALKVFRHLAGTLHFARTSQACHMTASALTRLIQRLEAEVGEPLFVRDNRSVELTFAGQAFRQYAEDVIRRWEQLEKALSGDAELTGELSLYCSVTAAYSILPDIISRYRQVHPKVRIHLETGDAAKALSKLMNRDVDAAIAALPARLDKRIAFLELARSPLVFIAPRQPGQVLVYRSGRIDWGNTPLIIPDFGLSRERLDRWFADRRITPSIYSQVSGHEAIIALVNLGCGIGLVPRLVLDKSPFTDQVKVLAGTPELPAFVIGLAVIKKQMTDPRIRALWSLADRAAAEES